MRERLNQATQLIFTDVPSLQLLRIDLPDSYESAIVATEVENQLKETYEYVKEATLERQHMAVDEAKAEKNITELNALANQNATFITQTALAEILEYSITKEKETYKHVKDSLAFTDNKNLLDYIYYMNLMKLETAGSKLLIDIEDSIVNLDSNGKGYKAT